jgi:putative FmdB family regulatory protein
MTWRRWPFGHVPPGHRDVLLWTPGRPLPFEHDGEEGSVPVYEYECGGCRTRVDRLLPHRLADEPGPCEACGGELSRRFSRVAVKLEGWGFSATDGMVADRPGRGDFKAVRERAERLSDGG